MGTEPEEPVSNPTEKPPESPSIKDDSDAEGPPSPPLGPPAQHCPEHNDDARDEWKYLKAWGKFERVVKVTECLALLAGVITAFFIGYQWKEMRKASGDAEKQLDEMKRTRILDERAWVGAFHVIVENGSKEPTDSQFRVEFQNTGKTPALKVSAHVLASNVVFVNWELIDREHAQMQTNWLANSGLLAPNAIGSVTTDEIDMATEKAIEKGMPYYVYGKIWYDDVFGEHHWSEFCYLITLPNFSALPVSPHNTCDGPQTNQSN
jgi:hypothetical protein